MEIQSIKNRFGIIGNSPALNYALQVAVQVANTDLTVLIAGESGVGKEVFSQIIHAFLPENIILLLQSTVAPFRKALSTLNYLVMKKVLLPALSTVAKVILKPLTAALFSWMKLPKCL